MTDGEGESPAGWLGELVEQSNDAVAAFDASGVIVYANEVGAELLGMPLGEVVGSTVVDLVHPDDLHRAFTNLSAIGSGARPRPGLLRLRLGDGSYQLLEISPAAIDLPAGPGSPGPLTAVTIRDNSLQDAHWNFLTALSWGEPFHECVQVLAEGLSNPTDGWLGVTYDEDGFRRTAGTVPPLLAGITLDRSVDETPGMPWTKALRTGNPEWSVTGDLPEPFRSAAQVFGGAACVVVPVPDPGGGRPALMVHWAADAAMADLLVEAFVRRPRQAVMLALQRRDSVARLEHAARHDGLTGLVNRARFFDALGELQAEGRPFGVCYLDLDRFKPVNDTLGHLVGDHLLVLVARRLERAAASVHVAARLGGDEFALACTEVDGAELDRVAARLVEVIAEPFSVDGHRIEIGASVGSALGAPDVPVDTIMAAADAALYEAKRSGRGTWRRDDG